MTLRKYAVMMNTDILFCDEKVTLQEGWPLVGVAL